MLIRKSPPHVILFLVLLLLSGIVPLHGAAARRGWTKVELAHADGKQAPVPAGLLSRFGAELIADYGTYSIVYVPKGMVTNLEAQAAREHVRVRTRDDLDVLQLPGGAVDAREGIRGVPSQKLARDYPPRKAGVYVLQFVAPARAEWVAELQAIGWTLSRYIPNNGYLVVGRPELAAQTRQLAFVQWLDFFHPYQKAGIVPREGASHDLLFELPAGAASEEAVEAIRAAAEGPIEVQRGSLDTNVYARMSAAAASALLSHELILSVSPVSVGELTDGRQVLSLTPNLNTDQSQPLPGAPNQYWNWVTSQCPDCTNMPHTTWKIGFADSGLDDGFNNPTVGHPDLAGRKYFGIRGWGNGNDDPRCDKDVNPICDQQQHGTLVAGVAAGSGATNAVDNAGFLLGIGGAPTAGMFMTKILTSRVGVQQPQFALWPPDAANNQVTIQNHSWQAGETETETPGLYTSLSRSYDIRTRDADDGDTEARIPLLFTVASGNSDTSRPVSKNAMAKNVLTVGGLENFRQEANGTANCGPSLADSFRNIMAISRVGTALPGYIKPDLMAPASLIVSAQTSLWWSATPPFFYCLRNYGGDVRYSGASGTSFAAPLGAAASLIVKRYLGDAPAATSPALARAVLIAGARSVRGGLDRTRPNTNVGPVPSQQQGFGRLTLEDILNGPNKPVFYDQSPTRLFTQAGQTFCARVRVRDASKPVKIALVWTDAPGTPLVPNPLVNDLQLEVRRTSNPAGVYVGNSLAVTNPANGEESISHTSSLPYDGINNVEYFRSFVNPNEELSITVRAANIAGDTDGNLGNFEQDFALAILNAVEVSVGQCVSCTALGIATQPASQNINAGSTATLNVVASGSGPFSYQWYEGPSGNTGTPVGTNSPSFTTPALSVTKMYWVRVTSTCNGVATVDSVTATVNVNCTGAPVITVPPTSRTITAGTSTTLSVTATQAASYQWYQGTAPSTANPVGTNSPTLTVAPATTTSYWVRITNNCGSVDSATVVVTVCQPVVIATHPASVTIPSGNTATLSVVASGSGPFNYQWYEGPRGNTAKPVGTNSPSFTTPVLFADTSYWVRVTSTCNGGQSDSNAAVVSVTCSVGPTITAHPASRIINAGTSTTLTVTASSAGPTTYQWYQGSAPSTGLPVGPGGPSLTVSPSVTTSYWVRVTNNCGFTNSTTATVTVCTPPSITTHPQSKTILSGQSTTLSVVAAGSATISYQWFEGASGVTTTPVGTNSSSFTTPVLTSTKTYWVRVTSNCNGTATANSNAATVTVVPPQITRRQFTAAAANSQTSITANWTQPTQSGALLVAVISGSKDPAGFINWTAPAGWVHARTQEWNNVKTSIYYIPNNAGGRTSETFTTGGAFRDQILQLAEYSGIMLANPLDQSAVNGNDLNDGYIETGYTATTAQPKELVISALTVHAQTGFWSPSNGFIMLDDRYAGNHLTTAVFERITTTPAYWGHYAAVGDPAQWIGMVVTFRSADTN